MRIAFKNRFACTILLGKGSWKTSCKIFITRPGYTPYVRRNAKTPSNAVNYKHLRAGWQQRAKQ